MSFKSEFYRTPDPSLWKGRIDSQMEQKQFRYHQVVEMADLVSVTPSNKAILLGFASDVGVQRNNGRTGAAKGPDYFRTSIGSLCWHGDTGFNDAGNIKPTHDNLEGAQKALGKAVHHILKSKNRPFIIGGGHETAFGHYLGIASFLNTTNPNAKLGILNIDAHFDLRPHNGIAHSGSPFLQAHEHAKENDLDLKYFVYGINRDNNTRSLYQTADEYDVEFCENVEVMNSEKKSLDEVQKFLQSRTHIYLTICLDVFKSSIAPGVSAPAWNGIDLNHALNVITLIKESGKLLTMDVCELNPELEENQKTVKVAGTIFSEWLG